MKNGKIMAVWTAAAALAVVSAAKADVGTTAEQLSLTAPVSNAPVYFDAAAPRRPLMKLLDSAGLGKSLDEAGINIYGYAEMGVTFYADHGDTKGQAGRSFDANNQDPTFNALDLAIERVVDSTKNKFDVGFKVEGTFGSDATLIHGTGLFDSQHAYGDNEFDPVNAYVDLAVPVGNGLLVRLGKFVTPCGVETIDSTKTPFYSRGFLFNYAIPLTHTGALALYNLSSEWVVGGGIIRGWSDALEDKNGSISVLGEANWKSASGNSAVKTTIIIGPELPDNSAAYRYLADVVYTQKLSDQWKVALEGDLGWDSSKGGVEGANEGLWFGGAGYATWTVSNMFDINGRLEYFNDSQGTRGLVTADGAGTNVYDATLGVTITPFPTDDVGSNLKIRPELRYDYSQDAIFGDNNNQLSVAISGYFTF